MCRILWVLIVWEICMKSLVAFFFFCWSLDFFDLVLDEYIGTTRICFNFFPFSPCPNGNWHFLSNSPVIDSIMYERKHSIFIFVILCGIETWFYYLVFAIMYLIFPLISTLFFQLDWKPTEFWNHVVWYNLSKKMLFGISASTLKHWTNKKVYIIWHFP